MNKQMTDVQVSTNNPNNDGLIYIEQENPTGDYNHTIAVHPKQIDLLIQWLQEAREEIINGKTS